MPSLRSVGTQVAAANNVAATTNLATPLPATRENGDLLLLFTACRTAGPAAPATPAGWTLLGNVGGTNGRIVLFGRVVDGAETVPTVSWTGLTTGTTSATPVIAQMAAVEGLDTAGGIGSIVGALGAASNQAASTTVAAGGAAITTVAPNAAVFVFSVRQDDAGTWATLATSDTITWAKVGATAVTTSGADMAFETQWGVRPTAGSVAAKSFSLSGASSFASSGVMIALKAAVSAPVNLPLAAAGGSSGASLALETEAVLPLTSAAATTGATLALSTPTPPSAYETAVLTHGPELYWPLNATDGATDKSGNGRDGTAFGPTVGGTAGGPPIVGTDGTCTEFDGTDDSHHFPALLPFANGTSAHLHGLGSCATSTVL